MARRALRGAARLLLVGVLAAAAASCGKPSTQTGQTGAGKAGAPAARAEIGSPAPEFTLADLNGVQVASSSLRGKVVILDFWATWCPPCREEIPHFVSLQSKYRDQGLQIVGVSLDAGGAKDVKPFADEHDVNYTMLIGNEDIARTYGNIYAIPTTFVLDRSGKIVQRFVGFTAPEVIEATIKPLLTAS
ncbi:MAG: TlpA family protein disulfide reductase [Bacteroidota bacterium]